MARRQAIYFPRTQVQAACAVSHFGRAASSAIIKLGLQFFILALTLVCTWAGQGAYASTLDPDAQAQEALAQAREALNDKAWGQAELLLERVLMLAPEQAEARVMLARYRLTDDGVEEAPAEPLRLHLTDLLAGADADPDLAAVVTALMNYVAKAGIEQGLIAPPEA